MRYQVNISGNDYALLQDHLYPGDDKEAVAVALCGRHEYQDEMRLFIHKVLCIPYDHCETREPDLIIWNTSLIKTLLIEASKKNMAIVKIHSHPNGYNNFSETDNFSDIDLFTSVYGWTDNDLPHASMIMLPDGRLFGRIILPSLDFVEINRVMMVGHDIKIWDHNISNERNEFNLRTEQLFGLGTTNLLKRLKIGVLGCSGTGSPLIEQLVRLGVGELILIDPDIIEEKNINRILNSTIEDARNKRHKVDVIKESINKIGIGTEVTVFKENIYDDPAIVYTFATCDAVFGCVDSVDGRHILNQLSTFYILPYFDLGVKLVADGNGGIDQVCGTIHYIQPGGSSLESRGQYNSEELRAAGLYRTNPNQYEKERKSGYIHNVNVDSPAVISINTYTASMAVNEFLSRIHPYRYDQNSCFSVTRFSLSDSYIQYEKDGEPDQYLKRYVGRGKIIPLLNMPELDRV